eukprot:106760-Rhodomonas_salina.1
MSQRGRESGRLSAASLQSKSLISGKHHGEGGLRGRESVSKYCQPGRERESKDYETIYKESMQFIRRLHTSMRRGAQRDVQCGHLRPRAQLKCRAKQIIIAIARKRKWSTQEWKAHLSRRTSKSARYGRDQHKTPLL